LSTADVRPLGQTGEVDSWSAALLLLEDVPSPSEQLRSSSTDAAEKIHAVLASKGLTLYQASQQSIALYGKSSRYFLPHNLYYDLRQETFTPSVFQVVALSRISQYRIEDWLRVLGIDLENIPRLQALLSRKRTALIDDSLTDRDASVPWVRSRVFQYSLSSIAPLSKLLEPVGLRRISSLPGVGASKFAYAKIGDQDALGFPELLPGSIVRADPDLVARALPEKDGRPSGRIFLVEHNKGLFCSRLSRIQENVVIPIGVELSYAHIELRVPAEAKLHGVVDLEIRSLCKPTYPQVPTDLARLWTPMPLAEKRTLPQLLATARIKAGLSFREAAAATRTISNALGDDRYRISATSICDYEVVGTPPRALHKLVTLCCIYGLTFQTLLRSIGLPLEHAGTENIPDRLTGRLLLPELKEASAHDGFLGKLLEISKAVPFFLRNAISPLVGLPDISLDDLFWIGGEKQVFHPYIANGVVAIVNRRKKTPSHLPAKPAWKQPVYLLMQRDGTYMCACCGIENNMLVIHPYTEYVPRTLQFRHRKEIEVVGQVVAVARRLL